MAYLDNYDFSDSVGFEAAGISGSKPAVVLPAYSSLTKKQEYLYEVTYDSLDYEYANEYYKKNFISTKGQCSAMRQGDFVGRNYDWVYDDEPSFIVRTPNCQGHKAVIGVAGCLAGLTKQVVESRVNSPLYRILPFRLLDGINEDGLMIEDNVVPALGNTGTTPTVELRESVNAFMLLRYMLDNFSSVDEAIDYITKYVEVFFVEDASHAGYELHWLLSDVNKSVVLEIVNNELVVIEHSIMTNTHINGVTFKEDGSVPTNADVADGLLPSSMGIDAHGAGLERYNILNSLKNSVTDAASMRNAMSNVFYSKAYTNEEENGLWYSEMVGTYDYMGEKVEITTDMPTDHPYMQLCIEVSKSLWENRTREDGAVWQTCHSSVYDLVNKTFTIVVQEGTEETKVAFSNSSVADLEARIAALEAEIADIKGQI